MKERRVLIFALLLAAALFGSGSAAAEGSFEFYGWGPRVGFSSDPNQFYFGAHFPMSSFTTNLLFVPSIDIGFGDETTLLSVNPDLVYQVLVEGVGSVLLRGCVRFPVHEVRFGRRQGSMTATQSWAFTGRRESGSRTTRSFSRP